MGPAVLLEYATELGVPAVLTIALVWYLLFRLIPEQQKTFREALKEQNAAFAEAIQSIIKDNEEKTELIIAEIKREGAEIRASIYKPGMKRPAPQNPAPPVELVK